MGGKVLSCYHYQYLSEFSQSSLQHFHVTCSVINIQAYPLESHPSTGLVLFYHLDDSERSYPRITSSQALSATESTKVNVL